MSTTRHAPPPTPQPSFFEALWVSIFTPGTTPTLLLATHVSFGLLLIVLALMYVGTRSLHFVALGGIAAGLWASITWFAGELEKVQKAEEEGKRIREEKRKRGELTDEESEDEELTREGKKDK